MRKPIAAQRKAFALVEQAVQLQAMLLSYIDVFAGLALIAAALVRSHFSCCGRRAEPRQRID